SLFTGDLDAANVHYSASIALWERLGDAESTADSLQMLGIIALRQGLLGEARSHVARSLEIERDYGSSRSVANLLEILPSVAAEENQVDRALKLGGAAAGMRKRLEIVSESPVSREVISRLEQRRRNPSSDEAWRAGVAMSREDAIAYALNETEATSRA